MGKSAAGYCAKKKLTALSLLRLSELVDIGQQGFDLGWLEAELWHRRMGSDDTLCKRFGEILDWVATS